MRAKIRRCVLGKWLAMGLLAPGVGWSAEVVPAVPVGPAGLAEAGEFERAPSFSARQLLEAELLDGPAHRVRVLVPTDGALAHVTIDSDYGVFECAGLEVARVRIAEIQAIRRLAELSRSDLFAEGVRRSIEQPIDAVRNIVRNPEETVRELPSTVGNFFRRVGRTVGEVVDNVREGSNAGSEEGGDPAARAAEVGRGLGRFGKGIIGYDAERLALARELGVDPYTDNEQLQLEMEKVSWVFFAGGTPLRVALAGVGGGAGLAVAGVKEVGLAGEIYDLSPAEVQEASRRTMVGLGISDEAQEIYLASAALGPALGLTLLRSLERVGAAEGNEEVLMAAAGLAGRDQGRFVAGSAELLAGWVEEAGIEVARLKVVGRLPVAVDGEGGIVIGAPIDHLSWTDEMAAIVRGEELSGPARRLVMTGGMSERAAAGLREQGWEVVRR
jgi:hypothetical protein